MITRKFQQTAAKIGLILALAIGFQGSLSVEAQEARQSPSEHPVVADSNPDMRSSDTAISSPQASPSNAASSSRIQLGSSKSVPLSRATTAEFYTRIQPILVNRCGAAGCHGRNPAGSFHLDVTGYRTPNWKRESSTANLQHVLTFIHPEQPDLSPLLILPNQSHGGLEGSMFTRNRRAELERLMAWTHQVQLELKSTATDPPLSPANRGISQDSAKIPAAAADPFDPSAFNSLLPSP